MTAAQGKQAQDRMFAALSQDDVGAWRRLITTDFFAHENGKAYDGQGFFDLVANAHRAGTGLNWSVTQERIVADCDLAVLYYVNTGSVVRSGEAARPTRWLESSSFRRVGGEWRAFLVTSMVVRD